MAELNNHKWPDTTIEELMEANAYLGCSINKRSSHFKPYLHKHDNKELNNDIINLQHTFFAIKDTCQKLYNIARNKGEILFLSGSNQSKELIEKYASLCMQNYMLTWPGGFLTNFNSILKSKNMAFSKIDKASLQTKQAVLSREKKNKKLKTKYAGIENISKLPDALVIINAKNHKTAILEAQAKNIPVFTFIDSNTKPCANNIIPINVNSYSTLKIVLNCMSKAILQGLQAGLQNKKPSSNIHQRRNKDSSPTIKPFNIKHKNNNHPQKTAEEKEK